MVKRFTSPQFLSGIGFLIVTIIIFFAQGGLVKMSPLYIIGLLVGISLIIWGLCKNVTKGRRPLTKDEIQYMSRINKNLHYINDYYQKLADRINISKISKAKIKEIDNEIIIYWGLKSVSFSKPPKPTEIYKAIIVLCYDLFKLVYLLQIKVRFSANYRMRLFIDTGLIPDKVGVGLSKYDNNGKRLTDKLLRVVGERLSLNETITVILQCKDVCYSMNNVYLWLLMYPRAHKKSRLNFGSIIKVMYGYRQKITAYSFAEVNKAVIKDLLGG